jgi:predicted MPP superfamily phosphohydrolase
LKESDSEKDKEERAAKGKAPEEAPPTRIDWWISTRDTILFVIYLAMMSTFLQGNKIEEYAVFVLIVVYIFHVTIMKYNFAIEVALKRSVASYMEVRELNRLAIQDIHIFHYNVDTRTPSIELLCKINFEQDGDVLIFSDDYSDPNPSKASSVIKFRMKPLNRVRIAEEKYATPDNRRLMIRAKFKRAVNKILTKLQAYHLYEKIKRNKLCVIPMSKIMKDYNPRQKEKYTAFSTV